MEKATVMKTFHGSQTPKSPTVPDRDVPFSSYLTPDEPINCHRHLTIGPGRCGALDDPTSELSIFDAHKYFNEVTNNDIQNLTIGSKTRVSPLINMYREHNPERGDITETRRYSSASSPADGYANIRNYRARSFHAATSTASSEASWNSQSGLLSHPPEAIPVSMSNPPHTSDLNKKIRASLFKSIWLFRRKCPCSGKKSVDVKEKTPETKTKMPLTTLPRPSNKQITRDSLNLKRQDLDSNLKTPIGKFTMNMETAANKPETHKIPITSNNLVYQGSQDQEMVVPKSQRFQPAENQVPVIMQSQRVQASVRPFADGFSFPLLSPQSAACPIKLQVVNGVDEDLPRDSLEVFRAPEIEPSSYSQNPIDRDRQEFPFPPSPKSRVVDDDVASDASSDLFEIETTSTKPIIYGRRDSLDEASNLDAKRLGTNNGYLVGRRSTDKSMTTQITETNEPSEASIDLSVITGEGFNRASVTNFSANASEVAEAISMVEGDGGDQPPEKCKERGSSGNGLSSCRFEKAVSVGPKPVKSVPGAEGQNGATASRDVSSRSVTVNKAPPARSETARMSVTFAT